jgi:hypothetical protein
VIATALAAHPDVALQGRDVTARFRATAAGLGVTCDPALDECLLELAALCTVAQAVYVVVEPAEADLRLTVRLAVVDGGVVRTATRIVPDRPALVDVVAREAVAALVAPASVASLVVEAPVGSVVLLDGLERGSAPLTGPLTGLGPGRHFVDVAFPGGETVVKEVTLAGGRRTRIVATPRPLGAHALVWSGWGIAVVGALVGAGAVGFVVNDVLARGRLEDFTTHYATDRDYNDSTFRDAAAHDHDLLTDLPVYGAPLLAAAGAGAVVSAALLFVGYQWPALFDPPAEESAP